MRPLASVAVLLASVATAHAAPPAVATADQAAEVDDSAYTRVTVPRDYRDEHIAVGIIVGLFTPLGEAGVELTWRPKPYFEVSGGAGLSFSGLQVAAMPRLILRGETVSAFVGAGLSTGNYEATTPVICLSFCNGEGDAMVSADLLWANAEAGVEVGTGPIFGRATLGAGRVIAERNVEGEAALPSWLPYASVTVGYRF